MKFSYETRSTRLGPCTWRRIGVSRPVKAIPKCSRVQDSRISTGFPRANGNADIYRTDNSRKREAELDAALRFVPAFSDNDLCHAIHG
jgi:hypothetical protein